jgi:hypothetical protein
MPVILAPEAHDMWLDCRRVDGDVAAALITPTAPGKLEAYEVSGAVNRAVNDGPALIAPAAAMAQTETVSPQPPRAGRPKKTNDDGPRSLF